jgi:hypothetical protein
MWRRVGLRGNGIRHHQVIVSIETSSVPATWLRPYGNAAAVSREATTWSDDRHRPRLQMSRRPGRTDKGGPRAEHVTAIAVCPSSRSGQSGYDR